MNNIKMIVSNYTIASKFSIYRDVHMMIAGHLLLLFYCIIFILGFIGNVAVIYVGIRKKKYQNVTNCYVINLALADLLFLSLSIPYTTYLALVDRYPFGELFCRIHMYLAYVFLLSTCNTLAAMSVDRYFYVVLSKSKLKFRTPHNTFIICIIIWLSSLILIIPYYIITINMKTCDINEQKNFLICLLIFCLYYVIPLVIMIICYTKLTRHVIHSNRRSFSQTNNRNFRNSLKMKQRHITKMLIVLTLAFAICWLPIHILELMKCAQSSLLATLIQTHPKTLYSVRVFSHALAYCNSCLNPYLYALLNRNFCFDLIDTIRNCFTCSNPSYLHQTRTIHSNGRIFSSAEIISIDYLCEKRRDNDVEENEDTNDILERESIQLTNHYISSQSEPLHI